MAWDRWYRPLSAARWKSARYHVVGWAIFGLGYVGLMVFVAQVLAESPGAVLLVLAAGSRLSAYISSTVGELDFLRGI